MEFKDIKKILCKDYSGLKTLKVGFLFDSEAKFLKDAIRAYGVTIGLNINVVEGGYNQIFQTIYNPESNLYKEAPEFLIIAETSQKLLSRFYSLDMNGREGFANSILEQYKLAVNFVNQSVQPNFIFFNFGELDDSVYGNFSNKTPLSFLYQIRKLNFLLMDFATQNSNVQVCDINSLQNFVGRREMIRNSIYYHADCCFDLEILPQIAKRIIDIIGAYTGTIVKCIIIDLDNTIWGGTIGDDGIEGIHIGNYGIGKVFSDIQRWLLQLKERGILLAVCSKNEESIAKSPFLNHPEMVLREEDISIFVANWNNKADNIRYIQSVLNIGFDSMVFIDDNAVERELVKQTFPLVKVPDMPEDPAEYLPYLYQQNYFETIAVTKEDAFRTNQYRLQAQRDALAYAAINESSFLKELKMVAKLETLDKFLIPRASQLTQRTNQFNLRTIRYTDSQLKILMEDENVYTIVISLEDKFGSYGVISFLILRQYGNKLFIDTWVMSCRVFKRGVENLAMDKIINIAKENNCKSVIGEYLPTDKNSPVKNLLQSFGFIYTKGDEWELVVEDYCSQENYISINDDDYEK